MDGPPAYMKHMKKPVVPPDQLTAIRDKTAELRDCMLQLSNLQEQEERIADRIKRIKFGELPEMMMPLGLDVLGLEAEGNLPAYDLKLKPYYHANIKADAPEAPEAFQWLGDNGHGDMIRRTYTISFGKGEEKASAKFEAMMKKMGVPFSSSFGVPWNTLTAWVKEQIEKYKTMPPLHLLGATVGTIAELKPRKEK